MAAPTEQTRVTPSGRPMQEGYQALITFEADPDVQLWETEVTPPGFDGGDPIEQTTMHNLVYHTDAPQSLIRVTPASFVAAYLWTSYSQVRALINVETTINVTLSTGHWVAFFGWLRTFEPNGLAIGGRPLANCEVHVSSWDPVNNVEAGPAYGTSS